MSRPAVLVIDGNRAAIREQQVAAGGSPTGEGYARTLESLAAVRCDIVHPADGEVRLPQAGGVGAYDGVAITGSALNVYEGGAPVERQLERLQPHVITGERQGPRGELGDIVAVHGDRLEHRRLPGEHRVASTGLAELDPPAEAKLPSQWIGPHAPARRGHRHLHAPAAAEERHTGSECGARQLDLPLDVCAALVDI